VQKDELIQIHAVLVNVRRYLEHNNGGEGSFGEYDGLGIAPHHLHRSKREHKLAVFTLSKNIASNICSQNGGDSRLEDVLGSIAVKVADSPRQRP